MPWTGFEKSHFLQFCGFSKHESLLVWVDVGTTASETEHCSWLEQVITLDAGEQLLLYQVPLGAAPSEGDVVCHSNDYKVAVVDTASDHTQGLAFCQALIQAGAPTP